MVEPPLIPAFPLPGALELGVPPLELPRALQPSYVPLRSPAPVAPVEIPLVPGDPEPQESSEEKKGSDPQLPQIPIRLPETNTQDEETLEIEGVMELDLWGLSIPLPKPEILVAAGTTATVSVAATLSATWTLKKVTALMKPLVKQVVARLQKLRKKEVPTWSRERLAQRRRKVQSTDFRV